MEKVRFFVYNKRYLPQCGGLIRGTPSAPVPVMLDAKIMRFGSLIDQPEDQFLKRDLKAAPANPHPKANQPKGPPLNVEVEVKDEKKKKGGRAADQ